MLRFSFAFCGLLLLLFTSACGENNGGGDSPAPVNFDRQAMLATWMDDVVLPNYRDLANALTSLEAARSAFAANTDEARLTEVRDAFQQAYLVFQKASPFATGKPEELRLREQFNTYPTDTELIGDNLAASSAPNLDLPSQTPAQGFPALEYLLYTKTATDFAADAKLLDYVASLVTRMQTLTNEALTGLEANRDAYVQNDGNSATASIDRTVNDFIFYYEKHLRAGKVGIPAGVFSDTPLADRAEARFAENSKELFLAALDNVEDFFVNHGLTAYLNALQVERDGELLSLKIKNQFTDARSAATTLNDHFGTQVTEDNIKLLQLYDELQKNVVLMKVDMLQALSINVDYVDADGD